MSDKIVSLNDLQGGLSKNFWFGGILKLVLHRKCGLAGKILWVLLAAISYVSLSPHACRTLFKKLSSLRGHWVEMAVSSPPLPGSPHWEGKCCSHVASSPQGLSHTISQCLGVRLDNHCPANLTVPLWIYLIYILRKDLKTLPVSGPSSYLLSDIKNNILISLLLLRLWLSNQRLDYNQPSLQAPMLPGLIVAPQSAPSDLTLSNLNLLGLGNAEGVLLFSIPNLFLLRKMLSVGWGQTMVMSREGMERVSAAQPLPPPSVYPFCQLGRHVPG